MYYYVRGMYENQTVCDNDDDYMWLCISWM